MSKLPHGWATAQLGDLLSAIVGGGTPSKANANYFQGSIPFMTVKDMHDRFIADTQDHITEQALEDSASTLIPADTLVVASRMSLGKIARPKVAVAINQDLKALYLHDGVDKTYVEYAWRAKEIVIQGMGTGTTVKGIRLEDIRGLDLAVAPSAEQTRIADQLDALLARALACNERIDAIPALLKRFRQAVLGAAICGDLTADWRDGHECTHASELLEQIQLDHHIAGGHARGNASDPTDGVHDLAASDQPPTWTVATLRDICEPGRPITYGILKPGPEMEDGVPYIRVADFPGNRLSLGSIRKTSPEIDAQFKRSRLHPGDLILSIRGTVGRVIETPPELDGANITQDTARLAIGTRMVRNYVHFALLAEPTQRRMQMAVRGVAVKGINIGDVRALQVPVPPYDEQVEITTRVVKLFSFADQIEARFIAARTQAQRLTPLLLAKAFRGELVPQHPNDEPASALLERIAAKRAKPSEPKARQPRAARAPKENVAMTKSRQDDDVKGQPYLADHLRRMGSPTTAEALYKVAKLPVDDFYKQLAWEVANGHVKDGQDLLEPRDEA